MPAGNTIGQAYVQILPSMNGFSKAMNTQGGAEMDAAGGSAGENGASFMTRILPDGRGKRATPAVGPACGLRTGRRFC